MSDQVDIQIMGHQAVLIQWQKVKSHAVIYDAMQFLNHEYSNSILELVPTYGELAVYLHQKVNPQQFLESLREKLPLNGKVENTSSSLVYEIPVCYEEEKGFDLKNMAKTKGISTDEIIELHSKQLYQIHFIGFLPGFPYLSGLHKKLYHPRLSKPRIKIPKGSVGIADTQTGIYPLGSPGGWNIIGRTPISLFSTQDQPPAALQAGNQLRFLPIDNREYKTIQEAVKKGEYKIKTSNG